MTTQTDSLSVTVNGEQKTLPPGATIADVLRGLDLDPETAQGIAVAVGDEVVRKEAWGERALEEGARVEVITAQQGG